jgi:hypothetical protein
MLCFEDVSAKACAADQRGYALQVGSAMDGLALVLALAALFVSLVHAAKATAEEDLRDRTSRPSAPAAGPSGTGEAESLGTPRSSPSRA